MLLVLLQVDEEKAPAARSQSLYSLADSLDKRRRDLAVSIQTQTGISLEEAEKRGGA